MTPFVLGSQEDVAGFALAGVGGSVCATVDDVERAFASLQPDQIVILSARAALLAHDRIGEWEKSGRGPVFVVLPPR